MPLLHSLIALLILIFSTQASASQISIVDQFSDWIEIKMPEDALNFQVSVENFSEEEIIISDLISPSGMSHISHNIGLPSSMRVPPKLYSTLKSPSRPTYTEKRIFSVNYRNNVHKPIPEAGVWKLRLARVNQTHVGEIASLFVSTDILTKRSTPRRIPIDIYLSDYNPTLSRELTHEIANEIRAFYQEYGIQLNFNIINWNDKMKGENNLEIRLPYLSRKNRPNLSLYLFPRAASSARKEFQGLAGCLPAFKIKNRDMSCALLVTYEADLELKKERLTKVMAHEIAHSLGQYHLVDDFYPFGQVFDPHGDTSLEDDPANVMHKTSEYYGHIELSPEQSKSIKLLPYVYNNP